MRSVVATTLKGYSATTFSIIFLKAWASMFEICSSMPGTSKPKAAEKSSSLPSITSTTGARLRFTSCARFFPPTAFHNDSR